mmetsp:Transcript_20236/g.40110  ORF Transcript_20236/g.40110 Transcript_20236/m.40110 type:complete len:209 (+) Transcript_20236:3336-3962(+)
MFDGGVPGREKEEFKPVPVTSATPVAGCNFRTIVLLPGGDAHAGLAKPREETVVFTEAFKIGEATTFEKATPACAVPLLLESVSKEASAGRSATGDDTCWPAESTGDTAVPITTGVFAVEEKGFTGMPIGTEFAAMAGELAAGTISACGGDNDDSWDVFVIAGVDAVALSASVAVAAMAVGIAVVAVAVAAVVVVVEVVTAWLLSMLF